MPKPPTYRRKKGQHSKPVQRLSQPSTTEGAEATPEVVYEEASMPTWTKTEGVIDYLSEDETIANQKFAIVSMLSLSKWRTGRQRDEIIENLAKKEGFDLDLATKVIEAWCDQTDAKRAFKIRGVFGSRPEACKRSQFLQRVNKNHDISVCNVGYWVPFDPDPELIGDQNYMEKEINQLKEGYAQNLEKSREHFEEQKALKAQRARVEGSKWGQEQLLKRKETKQEVENRMKMADEDIAQYTDKIERAKLAKEQAEKKLLYMAEHPETVLTEEDTPVDMDNVPKEVLQEIKANASKVDEKRLKLAEIESQRINRKLPPMAPPSDNTGPLEETLLLPHQAREELKKFDEEQKNVKTI